MKHGWISSALGFAGRTVGRQSPRSGGKQIDPASGEKEDFAYEAPYASLTHWQGIAESGRIVPETLPGEPLWYWLSGQLKREFLQWK